MLIKKGVYFVLCRYRSHLKEHLIVKHKWNEIVASSAQINFNLNARWHSLAKNLRKSKAISRDIRYKCP